MKKYFQLMRVHHYIKNLLVFVALFFSGKITDVDKLCNCIIGFAIFCLISSAVYIFNDIQDREKDRAHLTKCKRPIASGAVSVKSAWCLFLVLLVLAFLLNFAVFQ